jgi:hypothetical protein
MQLRAAQAGKLAAQVDADLRAHGDRLTDTDRERRAA